MRRALRRPVRVGIRGGEEVSSRRLRDVLSFQERAGPDGLATEESQPGAGRESPSRIDSFEIVRELGRGGFGVVYLARDPRLARLREDRRLVAVGEAGRCSSFPIDGEAAGEELPASPKRRRVPLATAGETAAYVRSMEFVDVVRVDRTDDKPVLSIRMEEATAVDVSSDGARVALGAADGRVEPWDSRRRRRISVLSASGDPITSLRFAKR